MAGTWTLLFLCLWGTCLSDPVGKDFAVVFMQNFIPTYNRSHLDIVLTSFFPDTQATVWLPNGNYMRVLSLRPLSPTTVKLPTDIELLFTSRSNMTVCVSSTKDISVVATNKKPYTTSVWVVYPLREWDTEYYIVTPDDGPEGTSAQVAIVNGAQNNVIEVLLKGAIQFENETYYSGEKINFTLGPWETVQLQSNMSFSGSHVKSQEPVGVFAGHSCAKRLTICNHICLQLPPIAVWGLHFVLPPLQFQNTTNTLYIMAAEQTIITARNGSDLVNINAFPGKIEELSVDPSTYVQISSTAGLMVLVYGGDGTYKSLNYDVFLVNLLPREHFCSAYAVVAKPGFLNFALVVAQRDVVSALQFNHGYLPHVQGKDLPETDLFGAQILVSNFRGFNVVSHPNETFGLFTVGIAMMNAYGAEGICLNRVKSTCLSFGCGGDMENMVCKLIGAMPLCPTRSHLTCMAWGNTHYRTFQGNHKFQPGNCPSHLVSFIEQDVPMFLPFSVERRPGPDFAVHIRAIRLNITLTGLEPGNVLVDGIEQYLPITIAHGRLSIRQFGVLTVLDFTFGLRVLVEAKGFLHLQIPSELSGKISGVCVDYKSHVLSRHKFMDCALGTWRDYGECLENITFATVPPPCHFMEELGVFQACHSVLDPTPFVESCTFDFCEGLSNRCSSLEAYALSCGVEGVNLQDWRALTECGLQCPEKSRYESCLSTCPGTCLDNQDHYCNIEVCYEGCVCEDGLLSFGRCVAATECGCMWQDRYYEHGSLFLGSDCLTQCSCFGAQVTCNQTFPCDRGQICEELTPGWWSCNSLQYMSCFVYEASHYISFDGYNQTFQSSGTHEIAGLCSPTLGLEYFAVRIGREEAGNINIKTFEVNVYGRTVIWTNEHMGQIKVDGFSVHTLFMTEDGNLQILRDGMGGIVLKTEFGLIVSLNRDSILHVRVPVSYADATCGLCAFVPNITTPECSTEALALYELPYSCGMMKDPQGPFRDCHWNISYEDFFLNCQFNLCHYKGDPSVLCGALSNYAAVCQEAGAVIYSWRTEPFCPFNCPENSTYSLCSDPCVGVCAAPGICTGRCQEGCVCNDGFEAEGNSCVPFEQCGCSKNGTYYKLGSVLVDNECQTQCVCTSIKHWICEPFACPENYVCDVQGGIQGCYYTGHGELPIEKNCDNTSGCVSDRMTCVLFGSSGFYSFDGVFKELLGSCNLNLAYDCTTDEMPLFAIYAEYIAGLNKSVNVIFAKLYELNIFIEYREHLNIWVDGSPTQLPVTLLSGKLWMYENGAYLTVETDFGLKLQLNAAFFSLILPHHYRSKACGLCADPTTSLTSEPLPTNGCYLKALETNVTYSTFDPCNILLEVDGPLAACYNVLNHMVYYSMCHEGEEDADWHCQVLQLYTISCQAEGVRLKSWRNENFCSFPCPLGSYYDLCPRACAENCSSDKCHQPCMEGCRCPDTLLWNGVECVGFDDCSVIQRSQNETVHFPSPSPNTLPCEANLTCQTSFNEHFAVCKANGQYLTNFRNVSTPLVGDGVFEILRWCNVASENWIRVVLRVHYGVSERLHLFYGQSFITITNALNLWVNGEETTPPFSITEGLVLIRSEWDMQVISEGMKVATFSQKGDLEVLMPTNVLPLLCGSCADDRAFQAADLTY